MSTTIKLRRGTLSQWNANNNVVLASGEPAFEIDTGRLKIGNGLLAWSGLPYSFILPTGFQAGTNIGLNYNNSNNTLTISATGSSGGSGSQGVQGIQGIQGSKIIWKGTWDTNVNYNIDDIVFVEGSSYICTVPHLSSASFLNDSTKWQLFSRSGSQGTNGSNGIQGFQGQSIQGSIGPQGIQGPSGGGGVGDGAQGIQGIQGIQGVSIQGVQGLQGSQGTNGIQGIQGIYGPIAGFPNQIIYKNILNNPSGSDSLTFDGQKLTSNSGLFNSQLIIGDISGVPSDQIDSMLYIYNNRVDDTILMKISNQESTLFNITNNISGSLFSINNIGGVPVFEILSNSVTRIGRYNQNDFIVNSSGNIGIGTNNPAYKLQVNGSFGAKTKSFRINHPSKSGYILEYGSLESPYHGVRLTGRGIIKNGYGKIELPDYLKDLIINDESINIQLSNLNHSKNIYISRINLENNNFEVKCDRCKSIKELSFFWTFTGIRKDTASLITEQKGNL